MLVAEIGAIVLLHHGHFAYVIDDPYIHLALSERIAHGHLQARNHSATLPSRWFRLDLRDRPEGCRWSLQAYSSLKEPALRTVEDETSQAARRKCTGIDADAVGANIRAGGYGVAMHDDVLVRIGVVQEVIAYI